MKTKLASLSDKIKILKDKVRSEEATKQSMVLPLLQLLGYDIFDPEEVMPEVPCDISGKGDRIDYIITIKGKQEILIECKECHQNVLNHVKQLKKYFVASDARFAILTNGITYLFFSDHDNANLMDEEPFYSLDMGNLSEDDIAFLYGISRQNYNTMQLVYKSQDIRYRNEILENLKREFNKPSKGFVSVLTSNFYSGKLHDSVYNKFATLVKDCIRIVVTEDTFEDKEDIEEKDNEAEEPCKYTEEEKKLIDIVKGWLSKYETEGAHLYIRKLSDGFIRVCLSNEWWNVCRLKYRPYWDYKICVKICKEALASKSECREVKTFEEFINLRSEIEAQCEDTKSRLFAYRSEHNK